MVGPATVASIVVSLTAAWGMGESRVKTLAGAATLNRLEVRPPGRGRRLVMVSYRLGALAPLHEKRFFDSEVASYQTGDTGLERLFTDKLGEGSFCE